jgi:hypothetical protein
VAPVLTVHHVLGAGEGEKPKSGGRAPAPLAPGVQRSSPEGSPAVGLHVKAREGRCGASTASTLVHKS